MYISSIIKCITKQSKDFNDRFETINDNEEKARLHDTSMHLNRSKEISQGKNKLKNKWQ